MKGRQLAKYAFIFRNSNTKDKKSRESNDLINRERSRGMKKETEREGNKKFLINIFKQKKLKIRKRKISREGREQQ